VSELLQLSLFGRRILRLCCCRFAHCREELVKDSIPTDDLDVRVFLVLVPRLVGLLTVLVQFWKAVQSLRMAKERTTTIMRDIERIMGTAEFCWHDETVSCLFTLVQQRSLSCAHHRLFLSPIRRNRWDPVFLVSGGRWC